MASRPHYMIAVIDALQALGSQATPITVYGWVKEQGRVRKADLDNPERNEKWLHREIRFARQDLFLGGLIDGAEHGLWRLTDEGGRSPLSIEDARRIMNRRHHPSKAPIASDTKAEVLIAEPGSDFSYPTVSSAKPTLGPVPSNWTATVTRDICGPGWAYSVRFGDRDVWKIGHTNDVRTRLSELNKHVPYEVLGERWTVFRTHKWATADLAYAMEQRILANLAKHRTTGERVRCSEIELAEVWKNSITNEFERA